MSQIVKIVAVIIFILVFVLVFSKVTFTVTDSIVSDITNSLSGSSLKLDKKDFEYEVCDDNHDCQMVTVDKIIEPSNETRQSCKSDGSCEDVPVNRLLLKHGTDKKYCNKAPYLSDDYVDNYWNANGLIDECEMLPKGNMQFAFKQHDQSFLNHTGTVQITITPINYSDNYLAMQILIGEDKNDDDLPDSWEFCGNVDSIKGKDKRIINCKGEMMEFVKLVNPEWNPTSLYLDYILVLKAD